MDQYSYLIDCLFLDTIPAPKADRTPLRRHKCFKKNELQLLHQAYNRDSHPSSENLQDLAVQLNVSVDKVRVSTSFSKVSYINIVDNLSFFV